MLYVNKKTKEVVELLFSDAQMCVYVLSVENLDAQGDGEIGQGIVFKGTKKAFKRFFKKANKKVTDNYQELDEAAKDEVYAITLGDRYGIMGHTAEYIAGNKNAENKEWQKFHEEQTEEDRLKMLEELKD